MKHIIAFAGSNSTTSINKQLATYAASLISDVNVTVLDLNDFQAPIYSPEIEKDSGIPKVAAHFMEYITKTDGIVVSLAEHNGAYSAAFKNIFDWASRINPKTFLGKPMLLMATSPGARGGASVLEIASDRFPRHDANIVATFSLPSFFTHFSEGKINDATLNAALLKATKTLKDNL